MKGELCAGSRLELLADTWWYGNSHRWTGVELSGLAELRARQGFDAVQIVVGIPPEVGPEHPDAASRDGAAWDLRGEPNPAYLALARERLERILAAGLRPIVYGGWGPQIDWLGVPAMQRWWTELAKALRDLDVIYCLCGEVDLHCEAPRALLPDRSSSDLLASSKEPGLLTRVVRRATGAAFPARRPEARLARRVEAWRQVLRHARAQLGQPLLVHTTGMTTAFELFADDPDLLANSTQTGHDYSAWDWLYERPYAHVRCFARRPFLNLEPWYEGIRDSFGQHAQLFAFWASRLAGSIGHAYGAHGIWNLGDGRFLSHWGSQTLQQATGLRTPEELGRLHRWFVSERLSDLPPFVRRASDGSALSVGRGDEERFVELRLDTGPEPWAEAPFIRVQGLAAPPQMLGP